MYISKTTYKVIESLVRRNLKSGVRKFSVPLMNGDCLHCTIETQAEYDASVHRILESIDIAEDVD